MSAQATQREATDRPRRERSELVRRILVAIPACLFAYVIVTQGGPVLAVGLAVLGVVALHELYSLMRRARPGDIAGFLTVIAVIALATWSTRESVLIAFVAAFPLIFIVMLLRARLDNFAWGVAATVLGIFWIGLPLAHAVFLRDLPHGDGLLIDVLVATFVGDTAAYLGGRAWGRRTLAPEISPNKTIEGLAVGVLAAVFAFWAAGLYQDWLGHGQAVILGVLVAIAAPVGDLFESAVKRDLEVKDTGKAFGVHGGALDRLDAVMFTVVVTFYAALALGLG